jgi:N-acetyl-beta-hexosaminidase
VPDQWGIHEDVFCAGKEEVFDFLETVFSEVVQLFPSPYIHIGGDEVPKARWKLCPLCQARMKKVSGSHALWCQARMKKVSGSYAPCAKHA